MNDQWGTDYSQDDSGWGSDVAVADAGWETRALIKWIIEMAPECFTGVC